MKKYKTSRSWKNRMYLELQLKERGREGRGEGGRERQGDRERGGMGEEREREFFVTFLYKGSKEISPSSPKCRRERDTHF